MLRFGTGGMPFTTNGGNTLAGIKRVHELGLHHMEMEFVHNVFIKSEQAPEVKKTAEENDVTLSVHGSYYVNLASLERPKWHAGISRVIQAASIGDACGAKSVTFHSAFRIKDNPGMTTELVTEGMKDILEKCKEKNLTIKIAPELTGKVNQYGDVEELVKLILSMREAGYTNVACCIDFAHKYARSNGSFNSYDEFMSILDALAQGLGDDFLDELHIHVSGITFTDKGESNHLIYLPDLAAYKTEGIEVSGIEPYMEKLKANRLEKNQFNWQDLMRALKKANVGGFVVCESPILELDALLMQKYYLSL